MHVSIMTYANLTLTGWPEKRISNAYANMIQSDIGLVTPEFMHCLSQKWLTPTHTTQSYDTTLLNVYSGGF